MNFALIKKKIPPAGWEPGSASSEAEPLPLDQPPLGWKVHSPGPTKGTNSSLQCFLGKKRKGGGGAAPSCGKKIKLAGTVKSISCYTRKREGGRDWRFLNDADKKQWYFMHYESKWHPRKRQLKIRGTGVLDCLYAFFSWSFCYFKGREQGYLASHSKWVY